MPEQKRNWEICNKCANVHKHRKIEGLVHCELEHSPFRAGRIWYNANDWEKMELPNECGLILEHTVISQEVDKSVNYKL